jgi:hypothetical protein
VKLKDVDTPILFATTKAQRNHKPMVTLMVNKVIATPQKRESLNIPLGMQYKMQLPRVMDNRWVTPKKHCLIGN